MIGLERPESSPRAYWSGSNSVMSAADQQYIEQLIGQLSHGSREAQERAIEALARLGHSAVPALRKLIPTKTGNQIAALARMGYPANAEAIADLVAELQFSGSFHLKST